MQHYQKALILEHTILGSVTLGITPLCRWAGFLILLFLPGAWISFGIRLQGLSFWPRLFTGLMMSPLVVLVQFIVFRTLGMSFEKVSFVLILINLPAFYLIIRRSGEAILGNRRNVLIGLLAVLLSLGSLAPQILRPQWRMYLAQTWLYADAAYGITRGFLIPEDAQFAGERLAYPVPEELVYRAVLAYVLDSPPATSYIWANLVWLIAVCGFAVGLVKELGGGFVAQLTAAPWLLFGINPLGFIVQEILPASLAEPPYRISGDPRFTSWLLKYTELNTMPVVLGMFIAMTYLLVRFRSSEHSWDFQVLLALLLSCIGMLYPILFPPACALIGAAAVVDWLDKRERGEKYSRRIIWGLAIVLLFAATLTLGHLGYLVQGRRMAGGAIHPSSFLGFVRKTFELLIALAPLLIGLLMVWRHCCQNRRREARFLLLGSLASAVLYPVFFMPYYSNEYKYVFTAAICLAPFGALAMDRVTEKLSKFACVSVIGVTLAVLVIPYVWRMNHWVGPNKVHFAIDSRGFYLRLDSRERLAGVCDAIRTQTPLNSLLVVARPDLHFPAVTNRTLYVAPEQGFSFDGVNQRPDVLLVEIRGYPRVELDNRRLIVSQLFNGDQEERAASFSRILEMKRPIAILLQPEDDALLSWLKGASRGTAVYQQDGITLWLVPPANQ